MVFSSFTFLLIFLPFSLLGYYFTPERFKNLFLLVVSYLFYGWGAGLLVVGLFVLSLFDYLVSILIAKENSVTKKKILLGLGILGNLSVLLYYKYWNFILSNLSQLLNNLGFNQLIFHDVILPIGVSFFTFQKISYLVDVYRGTAKKAESLVQYCLYVALFPQLIAGPIVRYHEIAKQLVTRKSLVEDVASGLNRFIIGLSKKILIADYVGQTADRVFALSAGDLTTPFAWLGILCYTFQIYFDFSGYSDMAIGLGQVFGFKFPENFNRPYLSKSIKEFWSRWHITLSNWMKEYLYIPLGGNRTSSFRAIINLWLVFILSGLWHGASWNFILWGAFHGIFLTLERVFHIKNAIPSFIKIGSTFLIVMLAWVLFRSDNLSAASFFYLALLNLNNANPQSTITFGDLIQPRDFFALICAIIITFLTPYYYDKYFKNTVLSYITSIVFFILSLSALAGLSYTPFLYFRF